MCTSKRQYGFSLIETVLFMLIVGIAAAGILGVMNKFTGHSSDPLLRKQALAIAESLLEEIELQNLTGAACVGTLGPDGSRANVNNVCAYDGYSTTAGILDFSTNVAVPNMGGYNISALTVTPIAALGGTAIVANRGVIINVTVTDPAGGQVTLTGYRLGT
jgi:MSHA pilin protein MshD